MAGEDVLQRIHDQYGSAFDWMLGIPEVAALLIEAVDPNAGFSPSTFEAKLHDTNWWKTTPRETREAQALWGTDIATYQANVQKAGSDLFSWAQQMGVTFTMPEYAEISTRFNDLGLDMNSEQAKIELSRWLKGHKDRIGNAGAIWGAANQFRNVAKGEYFYSPADESALDYGIRLATGEIDEAGMRQALSEFAASMHPHLADRFRSGETLANIIDPLRELVASEMEFSSINDIDPMSNEWRWLIAVPDPAGGARLPTAQEASQYIRRTKPQWWQTSHGREADAVMSETLLRSFGKVA